MSKYLKSFLSAPLRTIAWCHLQAALSQRYVGARVYTAASIGTRTRPMELTGRKLTKLIREEYTIAIQHTSRDLKILKN